MEKIFDSVELERKLRAMARIQSLNEMSFFSYFFSLDETNSSRTWFRAWRPPKEQVSAVDAKSCMASVSTLKKKKNLKEKEGNQKKKIMLVRIKIENNIRNDETSSTS